ncbi:MAG: hypothetical protein ACRDD1_13430 [Planctomycetia bacterium]
MLYVCCLAAGCTSNRFQLSQGPNSGLPPPDVPVVDLPRPAAGPGLTPVYPAPEPYAPAPDQPVGVNNNPFPPAAPAFGGPYTGADPAFATGVEVSGIVVDAVGRPSPRTSLQVAEIGGQRLVVADLASAADGTFRVVNLQAGAQYEIRGSSTLGGRLLVGTIVAQAPRAGLVLQLRSEGRSPTTVGAATFPANTPGGPTGVPVGWTTAAARPKEPAAPPDPTKWRPVRLRRPNAGGDVTVESIGRPAAPPNDKAAP